MLKRRTFWFGLGFGIITGTMLLQLMIWGQGQSIDILVEEEPIPAVKDTLIEDTLYNEKQIEEIRKEIREEIRNEFFSERELVEKDENEKLIRGFLVRRGMSSQDVIDVLLELQLIEDGEHFLGLLRQEGRDKRIVIGVYQFEGHPSPEEIIEQIAP